jgi:hypothetical protein
VAGRRRDPRRVAPSVLRRKEKRAASPTVRRKAAAHAAAAEAEQAEEAVAEQAVAEQAVAGAGAAGEAARPSTSPSPSTASGSAAAPAHQLIAPAATEAAAEVSLKSLKVPELRDRCKALNLPHSGVKAELVARLGNEGTTPAKPIPQLDYSVEEVEDKEPCRICAAPFAPRPPVRGGHPRAAGRRDRRPPADRGEPGPCAGSLQEEQVAEEEVHYWH